MSRLYLPAAHTEADLVLAGQIAEVIDSAELYVTWTPAEGRAVPEVMAELRATAPSWTSAVGLLFAAVREIVATLRGRPSARPALPPAAEQLAARQRS